MSLEVQVRHSTYRYSKGRQGLCPSLGLAWATVRCSSHPSSSVGSFPTLGRGYPWSPHCTQIRVRVLPAPEQIYHCPVPKLQAHCS